MPHFAIALKRTHRPKTIREITVDDIIWAEFGNEPEEWGIQFKRQRKRKGVRRRGIKFEQKVQDAISAVYPDHYASGPWIRCLARGERKPRLYQPDGLLLDFNRRHCLIVEVKLRHTADAWWQITKQYLPVCQFIFEGWEFSAVEVCAWYDHHEPFPINTKPSERLGDIPPEEFRVFISRHNGHDVR